MKDHSILPGNSPRRNCCMCHNSQQTVDARYLPAIQEAEEMDAYFRILITTATKCALVQPEILLQSPESVRTRVPAYQMWILQVFNFAKAKFKSTTAIFFCISFSLKPIHLFLLDLRFLERGFENCSKKYLEHIKILSTVSRPITQNPAECSGQMRVSITATRVQINSYVLPSFSRNSVSLNTRQVPIQRGSFSLRIPTSFDWESADQ